MNILFTNEEDKLHPLKLIHYLSIKSFCKYNPNSNIYLISSKKSLSDWMLLLDLIPNFYWISEDHYNRGLYVDLGYICKQSLEGLLNDKNYILEMRNVDYPYSEGLDKSFVYFTDENSKKNYQNDYDIEFEVLNRTLISPFDNTRKDNNDLFFHNNDKSIFYCFNTYLSSNYNDYLTYLDIEHIMTVDTLFTRLVREFVQDIPKFDFNF